jgi:GcrA cell cycle regulator
MEWDDELIRRLEALWGEGHSTAEIGRRLNVTKNAIVGKAHRLNLPPRPSPIRRDGSSGTPRPAAPRRIVGPTLPPLPASLPPEQLRGMPLALEHGVDTPGGVRATVHATAVPPLHLGGETAAAARSAPVRQVLARAARSAACCWPIGEPGTKDFHFCDAEAMPGKPYCSDHAQIAYVKVRDRREEAA